MTPRRLLLVGAILTIAGLALAATAPVLGTEGADGTPGRQAVGGVVVLVGWVALALGIHRYGRQG